MLNDKSCSYCWESRLNIILKSKHSDGGFRKDLTGCDRDVMFDAAWLNSLRRATCQLLMAHGVEVLLYFDYLCKIKDIRDSMAHAHGLRQGYFQTVMEQAQMPLHSNSNPVKTLVLQDTAKYYIQASAQSYAKASAWRPTTEEGRVKRETAASSSSSSGVVPPWREVPEEGTKEVTDKEGTKQVPKQEGTKEEGTKKVLEEEGMKEEGMQEEKEGKAQSAPPLDVVMLLAKLGLSLGAQDGVQQLAGGLHQQLCRNISMDIDKQVGHMEKQFISLIKCDQMLHYAVKPWPVQGNEMARAVAAGEFDGKGDGKGK
eukprot:s1427_g13.t1